MNQLHDFFGELYFAAEQAPPGLYRDIDTGREIRLDEVDRLPASLDGRIAAYVCVEHTWNQHETRRTSPLGAQQRDASR